MFVPDPHHKTRTAGLLEDVHRLFGRTDRSSLPRGSAPLSLYRLLTHEALVCPDTAGKDSDTDIGDSPILFESVSRAAALDASSRSV